jgi:hypothetical protein
MSVVSSLSSLSLSTMSTMSTISYQEQKQYVANENAKIHMWISCIDTSVSETYIYKHFSGMCKIDYIIFVRSNPDPNTKTKSAIIHVNKWYTDINDRDQFGELTKYAHVAYSVKSFVERLKNREIINVHSGNYQHTNRVWKVSLFQE